MYQLWYEGGISFVTYAINHHLFVPETSIAEAKSISRRNEASDNDRFKPIYVQYLLC